MKKIYHANVNRKKTRESILTSDKMDFRKKKIKRKRGHYLLIKGLVHKEDIAILKCVCTKQQSYKSKNRITKRRNRQTTITGGDFNNPFEKIDRTTR